jgi:hypothetical protein
LAALLALPPLLGHLGFNLINFLQSHGPTIRIGQQAGLKYGWPAQTRHGGDTPTTQLAQLVKLALANEVVLPLALNHGFEALLVVASVLLNLRTIQFGPILCRIAHEQCHLGQQSGSIGLRSHALSLPGVQGYQSR